MKQQGWKFPDWESAVFDRGICWMQGCDGDDSNIYFDGHYVHCYTCGAILNKHKCDQKHFERLAVKLETQLNEIFNLGVTQ